MYSVFSNYLKPLYEARIVLEVPKKPSEVYNQLRNIYNQGVKGIIDCERIIALDKNGEVDYDLIYTIWQNEGLTNFLRWINRNIVLCLGIDSYKTTAVKLRIATGMLNKLVDADIIESKRANMIHDRLVFNVESERILLINEDLPF
jgi:hypothetical protein